MRPLLLLMLAVSACDSGLEDFVPRGHEDADDDGYFDFEDCDDSDASVHPGAPETCDQTDEDCDDAIDEEPTDGDTWYADADGDDWGDDTLTMVSCGLVQGATDVGGDCDDGDETVNPEVAVDDCDDEDSDCDGLVDEDEADTWYADADGDGWGSEAVLGCTQPSGTVATDGDCDDADADISPDAVDDCSGGVDDDCDGTTDEGTTVYADADGDGFGDAESTAGSCTVDEGYVTDATDCDDGLDTTYPGAPEACDDVDADCDGQAGTLVFVAADTTETDWSASAATGTATAPAAVTLTEDGDLAVCGGPWYVAIQHTGDLAIIGQTGIEEDVLASASGVLIDGSGAGTTAVQGLTLQADDGAAVDGGSTVSLESVLVTGATSQAPVVRGDEVSLRSVDFDTLALDLADATGGLVQAEFLRIEDVRVDEVTLAIEPGAVGDEVLGGLLYAAGDVEAAELVLTDVTLALTAVDGVALVLDGGLVHAGGALGLDDGEIADLVVSLDESACGDCEVTVTGWGLAGESVSLNGGFYEFSAELAAKTASVTIAGGAVAATTITAVDAGFSVQSGGYGGALLAWDSASLENVDIMGSAADQGGGVFAGGALTLDRSSITGSRAGFGGGLYAYELYCTDSEISANEASDAGGGAYVDGPVVRSSGCSWGEGTSDNTPGDLDGTFTLSSMGEEVSCDTGAGCDTGI